MKLFKALLISTLLTTQVFATDYSDDEKVDTYQSSVKSSVVGNTPPPLPTITDWPSFQNYLIAVYTAPSIGNQAGTMYLGYTLEQIETTGLIKSRINPNLCRQIIFQEQLEFLLTNLQFLSGPYSPYQYTQLQAAQPVYNFLYGRANPSSISQPKFCEESSCLDWIKKWFK